MDLSSSSVTGGNRPRRNTSRGSLSGDKSPRGADYSSGNRSRRNSRVSDSGTGDKTPTNRSRRNSRVTPTGDKTPRRGRGTFDTLSGNKTGNGGRRLSKGDARFGVYTPVEDRLGTGKVDASVYHVDEAENMSCCNMKLSDLISGISGSGSFFSQFEQTVVGARKEGRLSHPGRSIASIRKQPKHRTMSLHGLSSLTASERDMTLLTDNILVGGRDDAEDLNKLMAYGVTHILNTAQQVPNYYPENFVYFKVAILDNTSATINETADHVSAFLHHIESIGGRVLVHCVAGVSRSVSMIILHLIRNHQLPLNDAFNYIRSCRNQICPNEAFKLQLANLEMQVLGYSSVAKSSDRAWDFYEWNKIKRSLPTTASSSSSSTKLTATGTVGQQQQSASAAGQAPPSSSSSSFMHQSGTASTVSPTPRESHASSPSGAAAGASRARRDSIDSDDATAEMCCAVC
mmetsp:Transcript_8686/g.14420  ORF Transcript_8686/g.14420 Transcript_8686/m.14420 type:complete len:459 (+) Transcript_8686:148-1524(+)